MIKYWLLFLSLIAVGVNAAPIHSQVGNLLANGSFESGSFDPVLSPPQGIPSAADNWAQWNNSTNGGPVSELITEAEMMSLTGLGLIDGNAAVRVTTNGNDDGLFTFFSGYGHPGWDVNGDLTFSGWVYVLAGNMGFSLGANSPGHFDTTVTSSVGQWEFISISKNGGGGINLNNEALLYADGGPADFIVDSVWINQGLESLHPLQTLSPVPEPAALLLFVGGLLMLASASMSSPRASVRNHSAS